ncbi:MAG: 1,4-beta-xylanase, partial [Bryobacteraceae bacterium]
MPSRIVLAVALLCAGAATAETERWTEAKAKAWYAKQPWLVGANYTPASAINQLEMWQPETFDAARIDKELAWAQAIGMNTMRVFLHDLLWQQDAKGLQQRMDTFLKIADKRGMKIMFVLFDSVWDPHPALGKQRSPKPGVHNSGWVQGPGAKALADRAQYGRLEAYVKGVVGAFANDRRV